MYQSWNLQKIIQMSKKSNQSVPGQNRTIKLIIRSVIRYLAFKFLEASCGIKYAKVSSLPSKREERYFVNLSNT